MRSADGYVFSLARGPSLGSKPSQRRTGRRGYFTKRVGSAKDRSQRVKTEPFAERTTLLWRQVAHSPVSGSECSRPPFTGPATLWLRPGPETGDGVARAAFAGFAWLSPPDRSESVCGDYLHPRDSACQRFARVFESLR